MIRTTLWLFSLVLAVLSGLIVYRVAQNNATRAWSAGNQEGYAQAQHDIALHWYRTCLYDGPYEDQYVDWHRYCDSVFESQLGFKNRWRGEMP